MKNYTLFIFVISFGFTYLSSLFYLKHKTVAEPSIKIENLRAVIEDLEYGPNLGDINIRVASANSMKKVNQPTETSTPVQTKTPTPTPSPTPTPVPTKTPEPTPTPVPTPTPDVWSPPDMEPIFARYAGQYSVDKNILERIANCESHFNNLAANGDYLGLFQFSTNTWINTRNQMGEDNNASLRSDIDASIKTAAYLISKRGVSPWPSCLR